MCYFRRLLLTKNVTKIKNTESTSTLSCKTYLSSLYSNKLVLGSIEKRTDSTLLSWYLHTVIAWSEDEVCSHKIQILSPVTINVSNISMIFLSENEIIKSINQTRSTLVLWIKQIEIQFLNKWYRRGVMKPITTIELKIWFWFDFNDTSKSKKNSRLCIVS